MNIEPIGRISLDRQQHRCSFTVESPWLLDRNAGPQHERAQAREHPDVRATLYAIEALLAPLATGGYELSPAHAAQADQIVLTFLDRPELASLVQGLIELADRLAAQAQSEDSAQAILGLDGRPMVLEPLAALVAAARQYAESHTTIRHEVDALLRADAYRAQTNFGTPGEYRTSATEFRKAPNLDGRSGG